MRLRFKSTQGASLRSHSQLEASEVEGAQINFPDFEATR